MPAEVPESMQLRESAEAPDSTEAAEDADAPESANATLAPDAAAWPDAAAPPFASSRLTPVIEELVERHGEEARARATAGVRQVAGRWREVDGDAAAFSRFCLEHFVPEGEELKLLRDRMEEAIMTLQIHLYEIRRHLRRGSDLVPEGGPAMRPFDALLAQLDPAPDVMEQMHRQGLAFAVLLNFRRPELATMLAEGGGWDADRWAEVRIAQTFGPRIPGELNDRARAVSHEAGLFVSEFHVPVGTLVDARGERWLEPDRKLIAHWLIREEIKAHGEDPDGLPRQRALMHVMRRTIEGEVPRSVMAGIDEGDWDPEANTVGGRPVPEVIGPERYRHLLAQFHLARAFDAHHPEHPTAMARKFELEREIPEEEVERLLVEILSAPERKLAAAALRERIGRPLEPHDIYQESLEEPRTGADQNDRVNRRFPDEKAFEEGLPELLRRLGFADADADELGQGIRVEIARGAGHAVRPGLAGSQAWLRTNRRPEGLGRDGFDTAMHELGHNLEQLISTRRVPRPILRGVPNTACTEAFAFLYQSLGERVLDDWGAGNLGRAAASADDPGRFRRRSLETLLEVSQIGGPSLLELHAWRWLYRHPDATPEALRDRVLEIAAELWSRFYEEDFGPDPYHTLAAYQHMIAYPLYLADYALGHIMSFQIRAHVERSDLAAETIRICSIGRTTPDRWMREAVGGPLSIDAILEGARA